jgi:hypothetical protein
MLLPYLVVALLAAPSSARLHHFRPSARDTVPKALITKLCSDSSELPQCLHTFRSHGRAWQGDINGDGVAEYVIFDGGFCGTLGCSYDLYQRQQGQWVPLRIITAESDSEDAIWITNRPRFEILPPVREGYHDLRIAVDECVKWDGRGYVGYASDDYHNLSPALFNSSDSYEAEIFWMIRYSGLSEFVFTPQWFPISRAQFLRPPSVLFLFGGTINELPRVPASHLYDAKERVFWIGLSHGGIWGIRGHRGFLLAPQQAYLGALSLHFHGDWLSGAEDVEGKNPEIEYNRHTHTLRITPPVEP